MKLDTETLKRIEETRKKYEFLTFLILENDIVMGIVQNETPKLVMIYQLDRIRDQKLRELFLRFGDEWWWGSNQSVPVNTFIGQRFEAFQTCLGGYPKKAITKIIGPTFNLADKYLKRVKKKRVEIINSSKAA